MTIRVSNIFASVSGYGTIEYKTDSAETKISLDKEEIEEVMTLAYKFINQRRTRLREELSRDAQPPLLMAPATTSVEPFDF